MRNTHSASPHASVVRSLRAFVVLALTALFGIVMLAAGCGRSSLEPETLDASSAPSTCTPETCPTGCCDANGLCRSGADERACGSGGGRCSDCPALGFDTCGDRKVCGKTVSSCGPVECPTGCCSETNGKSECLAGTAANACGKTGVTCVDCSADGRSCVPSLGTCSTVKCDSTNCNGCCVEDKCLAGTSVSSCGTAGEQCDSCLGGQTCTASPSGGGTCQGTVKCDSTNCNGCCTAQGQCLVGSDNIACGGAGSACQNCTSTGKTCNAQKTCVTPPTCGPQNCAGCCVGNNCIIQTTPQACGAGGAACGACGPNETCNGGQCVAAPDCSALNCNGCCVGGVCAFGSQNTACGVGGAECTNCTAQAKVCQGGACQQPACGPGNCAGCCSGNTCVVGTQDNACGPTNGQQCTDCTVAGDVCVNRACVAKCGPGNCAGCCQPSNTCVLGFANAACGEGGAACSNCTAQNSTCNALVAPRVCSNQQNTCPAPYAQCPGAPVATPVTPSLQGKCTEDDLDAVQAACAQGPDTATCIAAYQVLQASNAACATCTTPFLVPFQQLAGLYLCAAPFVNAACNQATGCAVDCAGTSCDQCPAASEAQCRQQVGGQGGQCATYVQQTACIGNALQQGQLCSPFTYQGNYGRWLRAVGDHFCGNGP